MKTTTTTAYINGKVRTMDTACSLAEAVLVQGDRIRCVGTTEQVLKAAGTAAKIIDLKGYWLFPGFIDTHSHLSFYSVWSAQAAYCGEAAGSLEGVLERLRAQAAQTDPAQGVFGYGFDDTIFAEGRGPTRQELDTVCKDRPVLLLHLSAHLCYCNSKALALAGIDAATKIPGGEVVLDDQGEPTGLLLENANFKALELFPPTTFATLRACLKKGISDYNANGFTSTHDAGIGIGGVAPALYTRLLHTMEKDEELNIRVYAAYMTEEFDKFAALGITTGFGTDMVRISGPKLFNDGSIQGYTAALIEPYYKRPDIHPGILVPAEKMAAKLIDYHCQGYQIAYHGNGDAGIEVMIAAMEEAQKQCPRPDPRHIMVHCQTASDDQMRRMQAVGILPTLFSLHIWYYGDRHRDIFLGPERAQRMNPSGTAVRLGMKHSLHADSPVFPPWSIRSIDAAVHRTTRSGQVLGAEQRISQEEAVRAYTSHAAYFQFAENEKGTIEAGKMADFVLLSQDLISCEATKIMDTEILMTMCGGRIVHGAFPANASTTT